MALELLDSQGNKIVHHSGAIEQIANEVLTDGEQKVQLWDFAAANSSAEKRIEAITRVASVCFQKPELIGSSKLYDKLHRESIGLPSSSFEFVPVLLSQEDHWLIISNMEAIMDREPEALQLPHVDRYGYTIPMKKSSPIVGGEPTIEIYKLTNFRALLRDLEILGRHFKDEEELSVETNFFNTDPDEIALIRKMTAFFYIETDIPTARQMMRHRASWQELSRRYTSGKKLPFEFYLDSVSKSLLGDIWEQTCIQALKSYDFLIENGVKAENARRVLPIGMKTKVWSAWSVPQLLEMCSLRTEAKAQSEIRELATTMRAMALRDLQ